MDKSHINEAQGQLPRANPTFASSRRTRQAELDDMPLESERHFYEAYAWCLIPCPKLCDAIVYLSREIDRLATAEEDWRLAEIMTNVYLLSSALLTSVEDYLHRPTFRLPHRLARVRLADRALKAVNGVAAVIRQPRLALARRWREQWPAASDAFLQLFAKANNPTRDAAVKAAGQLKALLRLPLPTELQLERIRIPSGFRKQDLTHFDALALARKFAARFPDRAQPILLVGLRTAGAYFASLVRAFLKTEGYQTVDAVNVRPPKGLAKWERAELARCCAAGYLAAIVDDPPVGGHQVALLSRHLRQAGFSHEKMVALLPVHHLRPDWRMNVEATPLSDVLVLSLDSEEWFKSRLLERAAVEGRLQEYFQSRGFVSASVVASPAADEINGQLQGLSRDRLRSRLKRVYAVRLVTPSGQVETRFVLAKSVGWGWLGYHAFIAGHRLAGFVPPILGLRDGILYMEWLPQRDDEEKGVAERAREIAAISAYVAARARALSLGNDPLPGLGLDEGHTLERVLARAFAGNAAARLMRGRIRHRLSEQTCPIPTLIDGNMRRLEWIVDRSRLFKSDFEHHGMGKDELNVTDPAFDLADAALRFGLSSQEEQELIRGYMADSGDGGVKERLFLLKLLAGTHAMDLALAGLNQPMLFHVASEFNKQYVSAWNFLTTQTARFCAGRCRLPQEVLWRSPLAVIDIDGVLDRRIFGFPSTTAAGIEALSLLHDHGYAVAANTARSVDEVKKYCSIYGFAGGVAEYGSFLWDAVGNRGRALVSDESLVELEELRRALRQLPGAFLNDGYEYSIRAYSYDEDRTKPLPLLTIAGLISSLNLRRLRWHQTSIDTTIVAGEVDKGRGLRELLAWIGQPTIETVAIGDSEWDLPMFLAAKRSFAPAQIGCASIARAIGCRIAHRPYQAGMLEIVRALAPPERDRGRRNDTSGLAAEGGDKFFLDLLTAADRGRWMSLIGALLDSRSLHVFLS